MSDGLVVDTTIVAAFVSAVVAIIILAIDRFWIEPRRWQSRYEVRLLERRVKTHAWLVSVLEASKAKAKRVPTSKVPYLLEGDDVRKLEDIFERKAYLLSDQLRQAWYDLQVRDTTFLMDKTKHRDTMGTGIPELGLLPSRYQVFSIDLSAMHHQAGADLAELRSHYKETAKVKLAN
jgi:hypothetical protein